MEQTISQLLANEGIRMRLALCHIALSCGDNRFIGWDVNKPLPKDMLTNAINIIKEETSTMFKRR